MAAVSAPVTAAPTAPWWRRPGRATSCAAIFVLWLAAWSVLRGRDTLYLPTSDTTGVHDRFTAVRDWIDANRATNPFFTDVVDVLRQGVDHVTTFVQALISQPAFDRPVPLIGWLGVVALATFGAYAFASVRTALLTAAGLVSLGLLGLWSESMDTLAVTLTAVALSLVIGIPLGVLIGLSRRAEQLATPVLDVMQALPTFCYLAPLSLFFLIGPAAAVITTLIYAVPPVIRLTAHGIAEVSPASLEASRALGATRWQILRTVQLPLAKRTIVIGINQTTMAALSMVMIAALIDAPGIGPVVLHALSALDIGTAFVGGLAIVILAVVADRVTTAASERAEAHYRAGAPAARSRRWGLLAGGVLTAVALYLAYTYYWAASFPVSGPNAPVGSAVSDAVNAASNWVGLHLSVATTGFSNVISYGLINPLQALIAESPWYLICAVVIATTWTVAGARAIVVASVCLGLLLATGLWQDAMVTLTSVLVATLLVLVVGVVLGVWIARSRRADAVLRPILDAAQVMPALVYLIPALGLLGPSRLTAIVAAVVFAVPVTTKIVAGGVREVPETIVEAATASGSSGWQIIAKVQLPLARHTLVQAANQGLLYVLSVVVVGALVGAGALGYLVVAGFSQSELFGKGLTAGIAIVLLGILLDRVAKAAARRALIRERGGTTR